MIIRILSFDMFQIHWACSAIHFTVCSLFYRTPVTGERIAKCILLHSIKTLAAASIFGVFRRRFWEPLICHIDLIPIPHFKTYHAFPPHEQDLRPFPSHIFCSVSLSPSDRMASGSDDTLAAAAPCLGITWFNSNSVNRANTTSFSLRCVYRLLCNPWLFVGKRTHKAKLSSGHQFVGLWQSQNRTTVHCTLARRHTVTWCISINKLIEGDSISWMTPCCIPEPFDCLRACCLFTGSQTTTQILPPDGAIYGTIRNAGRGIDAANK